MSLLVVAEDAGLWWEILALRRERARKQLSRFVILGHAAALEKHADMVEVKAKEREELEKKGEKVCEGKREGPKGEGKGAEATPGPKGPKSPGSPPPRRARTPKKGRCAPSPTCVGEAASS